MPAGQPIRVVLADDDPGYLESLAAAMEADGRFEVVGLAANGEEAFQVACWQEPDVIVLDVEMPVLTGFEAARLLRQSRPRTCVLMVSGADEVVAHDETLGAVVGKFDMQRVIDVAASAVTADID
jgi:DNA-binding NarL/FixJ family response regulator